MNAYELADALLNTLTMEYDCDDYMEMAAHMLCKQADEINDLKEQLTDALSYKEMIQTMEKAYQDHFDKALGVNK